MLGNILIKFLKTTMIIRLIFKYNWLVNSPRQKCNNNFNNKSQVSLLYVWGGLNYNVT